MSCLVVCLELSYEKNKSNTRFFGQIEACYGSSTQEEDEDDQEDQEVERLPVDVVVVVVVKCCWSGGRGAS